MSKGKQVLVTGGAGYIGSFMTTRLLDGGFEVTVADSLEKGHREALDKRAEFVLGNILDKDFVRTLFQDRQFAAVFHFAAYISMGESMEKPGMYFENNVFGAINLLENMVKMKVGKFVFSSTAGVYGNPQKIPIPEDHPKNPANPYGESKLFVEKILQWYNVVYGISSVCLRYFNAAGAALDGTLGEHHPQETHIIPNIINATLANKAFTLFGADYQTKDGTCIRDYIHVLDLVHAHVLALRYIEQHPGIFCFNVGTGNGYSNKEVIEMVKQVSGKDIMVHLADRRPGDADVLIADASKMRKELGFEPKYSDLEKIVITAWEWHRRSAKFKVQSSK